jgi:hypothetical protein
VAREQAGTPPSNAADAVRKQDLTAANITDSTSVGRSLVTAADAAAARKTLDLGVFDARDYGVIADGLPHNNVANLLDCVTACANSGGGTVLLPAGVMSTSDAVIGTVTSNSGTVYTNNGGIPIPAGIPITIKGQGTGVTVLKLSTGFTRAFDFWYFNNNQVFNDIHLRDFTVDRNNLLGADIAAATAVTGSVTLTGSGTWTTLPGIPATTFKNAQWVNFASGTGTAVGRNFPARISSGNVQIYNGSATNYTLVSGDTVRGSMRGHVILGTNCGLIGAGSNMKFDNITVNGVEAINVAESSASNLNTGAINRSLGIDIYVTIAAGSTFVPQVTNFMARNVRVEGGAYGIQVTGNPGTFLDEIWFVDCYHDTGIDVTTNWNSSNFIIGGSAWVNRCGVVRCTGRRTGDVGIELDQPWDGYEIDCTWENGWQSV